MRDDDLTTFDPPEGDPPSAEFVEALLERLDMAWRAQADGHDTGLSRTHIDLTVLDQKENHMGSNFHSGGTQGKRGMRLALAAAAIVVLIVGLVVTLDSDGTDKVNIVDLPDTTLPPDSTPPPEPTLPLEAPVTDDTTNSTIDDAASSTEAPPTAVPSEWDFDFTYIDVEAAGAVAANEEFAWVAARTEPVLSKIDLSTNTVISTAAIPAGADRVNYGFGSVWINHADGTVSRFDPDTETVVATFKVGEGGLSWTSSGPDSMWVGTSGGRQVVRIDPTTNSVSAIVDIGSVTRAVKAQARGVWVRDTSGVVHRIDPETATVVASIETGVNKGAFMAGPDAVWAPGNGELFRIDPATNSITATIDISEAIGRTVTVGGIHFGDGTVWVRYHHSRTGVARVDPATNEVVAHKDLRDGWAPTGGMNVGPTTAWTFNATAIARIDFDN